VPEFIMILIRALVSFLVLLILARLMGHQHISQLTFFDYVVGITIGSIAATASVDQNVKILNGLAGLLVWGILPILISLLNLKSYRFRRLTDGQPIVLVQNGKILEENLRKARLSLDSLMLSLREKNAFKLSDVEFAVLETNGSVSVLKKTEAQPVTPKTLGMIVEKEHDPRIVISDGQVMETTLKKMGYTKEWLLGEIKKQGANTFQDVFLAQLESNGNLYVDLRNEAQTISLVPEKPLVAATLQKVYADLLSFSLETENQEAKQMYKTQADRLKQVLDDLKPDLGSADISIRY
jgi:uncharacterized membrane protein YcaP (DUF421 family)